MQAWQPAVCISRGKETLNGIYWNVMCTIFLLVIGSEILKELLGPIAVILLVPFQVGLNSYGWLPIVREKRVSMKAFFEGYSSWNKFTQCFGTFFLYFIFIFLWSLLFIIPGIIKAYSYSQAFFLIADNSRLSPMQALEQSEKIMEGKKMSFFCLQIRFLLLFVVMYGVIGLQLAISSQFHEKQMQVYYLLVIFVFLIVTVLLTPYMFASYAHFYEAVKLKPDQVQMQSENLGQGIPN